ncbi:hypothetical protein BH10PLA2_BH10PLA2_07240 [soil metagenome]
MTTQTNTNAGSATPTGQGTFLGVSWLPFAVIGAALTASVTLYVMVRQGESDNQASANIAAEAMKDLESRGYRPLTGALSELLADPSQRTIPTQGHPLLESQAPDFQLTNAFNDRSSLSDALRRGPVVLVFYYGYFCNHCVSQLFALNKDRAFFDELGATIVAISDDSHKLTRERFDKYGPFQFPVLSDPGHRVALAYGTYKPAAKEGDILHGTFVIARDGRLIWANRGDSPFTDNRTLLRTIAISEGRIEKQQVQVP